MTQQRRLTMAMATLQPTRMIRAVSVSGPATVPLFARRSLSKPTKSAVAKRPNVATNDKNNTVTVKGLWYTSSSSRPNNAASSNLDMGRYGLRKIDYSKIDPQTAAVWAVPPHPPTKSMQDRVIFPLTLLIVGGFGIWAYLNPEDEDMRDYWKRVETGQILMDDDEEDEEDDE